MYILLILIVIFGLALLVNKKFQRPKNFPPGPFPLPLIGNLLNAGFEPHKSFIELGKKYGNIFAFDLASYTAVVINDITLIRQCLLSTATFSRPNYRFFIERSSLPGSNEPRGLISSGGLHWIEQQRFVRKSLRDFGVGKSSMEQIIKEEVSDFIDTFKHQIHQPINTRGLFNAATLNSLLRIVTGIPRPQSDRKLQELVKLIELVAENANIVALTFPKLTKWFPNITGYNGLISLTEPCNAFIKDAIKEHRMSIVHGQPRDIMDAAIDEIAQTTDPKSSFYSTDGEWNIMVSITDLFLGGGETTSTTVEWICLLLALNSHCQDKMFNEINRVVGNARVPELADRLQMPYTESVIMETLRIITLFPLSIHRSTTEDICLGGYVIPKGTVIVPNLYAVHHSSTIWGDPEVFRPERFILPNGTVNRLHDAFVPFSIGKRSCVGEKLAKDQLFLFVATLFQLFWVSLNPKEPKPTLTHRSNITSYPKPHKLIFHERHL